MTAPRLLDRLRGASTVTPLGSPAPSRFHTQRSTAGGGPPCHQSPSVLRKCLRTWVAYEGSIV